MCLRHAVISLTSVARMLFKGHKLYEKPKFESNDLTDKKNYCILFVADHSLNIVIGSIHMFQTFNDIMSEKKRCLVTRENPAKKRRSSFWKLIPSAGQQLEPDHENWLVIDLPK